MRLGFVKKEKAIKLKDMWHDKNPKIDQNTTSVVTKDNNKEHEKTQRQ